MLKYIILIIFRIQFFSIRFQ